MRYGLFAIPLACLALGGCNSGRSPDTGTAQGSPLIGSWALVEYDRRDTLGNVLEAYYGDRPLGNLVYAESGDMSVHLVDRRIGAFASEDFLAGTNEEVRAAYEGYFGYFGTYSIDPVAGTVTHHVAGASFRGYTGSDMTRSFELSGDRLSLTSGVELDGGVPSIFHLVWEKRRE